MIQAAARLDTLALVYADELGEDILPWAEWLAPRVTADMLDELPSEWPFRYLELESDVLDQIPEMFGIASRRWPDAVISARLPLSEDAPSTASEWAHAGISVSRAVIA